MMGDKMDDILKRKWIFDDELNTFETINEYILSWKIEDFN